MRIQWIIPNIFQEEYWGYGEFQEVCEFQKYKEYFEAVICEEGFDESKIDKEFLDDNNWMVVRNEM